MDSFTSWRGLLGQCSTMLNGCQAALKRGCGGQGAPSNAVCSGTSEDRLCQGQAGSHGCPFLLLPYMSSNLNFTYLQSIKDGYALLFHFGICLGLTWVHISLLLHSYHCCRVPLSFPAGYSQGPQPRNPFPTHLVDQNFINFPMKDA